MPKSIAWSGKVAWGSVGRKAKLSDKPANRYLEKARVRLLILTLTVLGGGLALVFFRYKIPNIGGVTTSSEPWRDLGLALIIAALVTLIYERYARERAAAESVDDVLEKIIGDVIDKQIWREIRQQILHKTAIRRKMAVRLELQRREGLPDNIRVLWVEMEYQISSLSSYRSDFIISHHLDTYMHRQLSSGDLPRFVYGTIDGMSKLKNEQSFEEKVSLAGRDDDNDKGRQVLLEREELVYIPGACNLMMTECTELNVVSLRKIPSDVSVTVSTFFCQEQEITEKKPFSSDRLLLPGQCLEFHFTKRTDEGNSDPRGTGG